MRGYIMKFMCVVILLTVFISGCGSDTDRTSKGKGGAGKGNEVRREVGEALEATKDYLADGTEKLKSRFDDQIKSIDEGLEELKRQSAGAGEKGREYRDRALRKLEEKKATASERMEEFGRSSGELRREAAEKLDAAMKELEEAYEKARKSFEGEDQ